MTDLGETLAESDLVALGDEVADGECITVDVSRGEALVGHVEEGEVALLLDDLGDLLPVLLGWVNTSRVVGTGMQEDNRALGSTL